MRGLRIHIRGGGAKWGRYESGYDVSLAIWDKENYYHYYYDCDNDDNSDWDRGWRVVCDARGIERLIWEE